MHLPLSDWIDDKGFAYLQVRRGCEQDSLICLQDKLSSLVGLGCGFTKFQRVSLPGTLKPQSSSISLDTGEDPSTSLS